jgi:uncharacterized membrane protein
MIQRKTHLDSLAIGLLIACCAFWGLQQILIKTTVTEVPPMWQASIRMVGAVALLWLWCVSRGVPLFERDGTLWPGLLAGLLFSGEFAGIYLGLQNTSASRLTVFLYTAPFWVSLLLPRWVPAERLRGFQWLGLFIAFAGVVLAFSEGFGHMSSSQLIGDALGLAAGMLWGLTTLTLRTTKLATASAEKTLVLPSGGDGRGVPGAVAGAGRALELHVLAGGLGLDRPADRDRRLRQLPHLDVAAAALPGHADVVLHLSHAAVRAGVRRGAAEGAAHGATDRGADRRGAGHRAGEPPARGTTHGMNRRRR